MNIFLVIFVAIFSSLITHVVTHKFNKSPIFSSACLSLIFAISTAYFLIPTLSNALNLVFFGGTFVGMTHNSVIRNWKQVSVAGFVFGLLYVLSSHIVKGYGGILGFNATISVCATMGLIQVLRLVAASFLRESP